MKSYDVIVIGLGGMGSAIAHNLAKHGVRTLGLERFSLNHTNGSSHGRTRIIRTAYFEHPSYVPLVKRAMELWFQLQKESEIEVIRMTGGLMVGERESELVSGTLESAEQHRLPHEILTFDEAKSRFPMFNLHKNEITVYQRDAGILFPEKCVEAHAHLAQKHGAELHFGEQAGKWSADKNGVVVKTEMGSYGARSLVFASGAWTTQLLAELNLPLQCERQTVFWFKPLESEGLFGSERMPIFVWQDRNRRYFYGFPNLGEGVKVAQHHGGQYTTPDAISRNVTEADEMPVRGFLESHMPWASGPVMSSTTCLYTNSPDGHFMIGHHPEHRNVIIVSPCSGHGFKFATAIGEAVREMVVDGKTTQDLSLFNVERFAKSN
jgi:sarcosine oxidase